ncbi:MAG TPA: hypothetical protein VMC09_14725 [Anaerolineales bacterium]|nr:hypothetical protein [Anaerolineales bacterium]
MKVNTRLIAVIQLVVLVPAGLFMSALVIRSLAPGGPASLAQGIVDWYAGRIWTLWVLLIALPMSALLAGLAALLAGWNEIVEKRMAALLVAAETVASLAVLSVVAVHMLMN